MGFASSSPREHRSAAISDSPYCFWASICALLVECRLSIQLPAGDVRARVYYLAPFRRVIAMLARPWNTFGAVFFARAGNPVIFVRLFSGLRRLRNPK
jgi:hypothetical protein